MKHPETTGRVYATGGDALPLTLAPRKGSKPYGRDSV